jgi:hypothetical protein
VYHYAWESEFVGNASGIFGEGLPHVDGQVVDTIDTRFRSHMTQISTLKYLLTDTADADEKQKLQVQIEEHERQVQLTYHLNGQQLTSVGMTFIANAVPQLDET